jgi:hypothetical protein
MKRYRLLIVPVALAAMLLATPSTSEACGFFDCLFGGCGQTAYAPAVAATYAPAYTPGCSTCTAQTVAYTPQTYYRTAYRAAPVTAYRSATYWNRQSRVVPYMTSRYYYTTPRRVLYGYTPAVSCNTCGGSPCGCAPASACGTSACGSGGCGFSSGGSGCSSCSVGTTYSQPQNGAPSIAPSGNNTPSPTFQETKKVPTNAPKLKPIPETGTQLNSTQSAPMLIDPENRTTARPIRQAVYSSQVTHPQHGGVDSGWRASRE